MHRHNDTAMDADHPARPYDPLLRASYCLTCRLEHQVSGWTTEAPEAPYAEARDAASGPDGAGWRRPMGGGSEIIERIMDAHPVGAYVAGWNMPGYLPETDPETFETLADAAAYLRETLARWLDDDEAPEDMTAENIIIVDTTAGYADGWYTPPAGGAEIHFWAHRAE